eukprot:COSAG02_NODE_160_length_32694_cov_18.496947_8_plen_261_part_00
MPLLLLATAMAAAIPGRAATRSYAELHDSAGPAAAGTGPPPCSLNGVGSPCKCDPGWTGANCGQLDLLPAPALASQVTALSATTTRNSAANSTWGISVVGPDETGRYHGYMTEIANSCPLGDYGFASQIVHMTAAHPLGPWARQGVALAGFAHNPQAVVSPNGSILLFHIGKELAPGCLKNCTTGRVKRCSGACERSPNSLRGPDRAGDSADSGCTPMSHATSVAVADSFDGPWTRYPYILGDRPTNPAPFICEYRCACH